MLLDLALLPFALLGLLVALWLGVAALQLTWAVVKAPFTLVALAWRAVNSRIVSIT